MKLTTENIIIGLVALLALWYLVAMIFNRRRGLSIYHWLKNDLDKLGGEASGKWIGTPGSGAQLHIHKANPPFRNLDVIYLLASRELLPLFLLDLARGKRDQLIVKAEIRPHIIGEVEVVPENSKLSRQLQSDREHPWDIKSLHPHFMMGTRGSDSLKAADALAPFIDKYKTSIHHISWSRKKPHLIVTLSLANLYEKDGSAAELYTDLQAIIERLDTQ